MRVLCLNGIETKLFQYAKVKRKLCTLHIWIYFEMRWQTVSHTSWICYFLGWWTDSVVNGFKNFCNNSRYTVYSVLSTRREISCWLEYLRRLSTAVNCATVFSRVFYFAVLRLWHCSPIHVGCLPEWHKMNSLKASVSVWEHVNVPAAPQFFDVACVRDLHWKLLVRIELAFLNNNNNNNNNNDDDDDNDNTSL